MSEQLNIELNSPKILSADEFAKIRADFPAEKKIVFTNGCFDILHAGHVDLLSRAREQGDLLVLGLNSDKSVRSIKGEKRPVTGQQQRAFVLAGLACIDYVIFFDEDTPYNLINKVQPDVLIKGGDWTVDNIVGRDIVEGRGGEVLSLPLLPGYSTTGVIRHIRENEIE
ncbi:D-glycero-beta-D-manno-heptose 1-phosphate adenylyltransferase [Maridesulfovibrio salexigens]|uniref:D-glycero-beta-D-manno-heptose 1-phosphate adenylyltransferase n=1 Tax=Maridesulfovibrio salexigens (strain ATCC 14822 / DSM 2638 / NCIMB 8403 / VKM B-1763) TaxID=526222 RepID=C6BS28_MARSD|nr:D-glycero-beta-D-manno-heptose 1-phosphate adenylyltransferase [Maridesulfovibrio salexigens]ACS81411.1 rfaE bifunctional protein [Maridesulfovibrio salexigens DSM 2638]